MHHVCWAKALGHHGYFDKPVVDRCSLCGYIVGFDSLISVLDIHLLPSGRPWKDICHYHKKEYGETIRDCLTNVDKILYNAPPFYRLQRELHFWSVALWRYLWFRLDWVSEEWIGRSKARW